MPRRSIKQILMDRDRMSAHQAEELIAEAQVQMSEYLAEEDYDSAYDICREFFGLEPDYFDELL